MRLHFLAARGGKTVDMQRQRMRTQHLISTQDRRIADDVDAVEFCLDDRVLDRSARTLGIAEHEGEPVARVVDAVAAHQCVRRTAHHHTVGRQPIDLIVVDDCAAHVLRDDSHPGTAADAVAADHRTRPHQVNSSLLGIEEVVALHENRNIPSDDARVFVAKTVVVHTDGIAAYIRSAAHRP